MSLYLRWKRVSASCPLLPFVKVCQGRPQPSQPTCSFTFSLHEPSIKKENDLRRDTSVWVNDVTLTSSLGHVNGGQFLSSRWPVSYTYFAVLTDSSSHSRHDPQDRRPVLTFFITRPPDPRPRDNSIRTRCTSNFGSLSILWTVSLFLYVFIQCSMFVSTCAELWVELEVQFLRVSTRSQFDALDIPNRRDT